VLKSAVQLQARPNLERFAHSVATTFC